MNFLTDYRPTKLKEVVGQKAVVKALTDALDGDSPPKAYLFTGPSGTGKTTIARIVASEMGVEPGELIEVDAATTSGVEAMRKLTSMQNYSAMGGGSKMVIVDECHSLSKQSWQALLKPIEDAPTHFFWAFCTTEVSKVPKTIKTRCHTYALSEVGHDDLVDLLTYVAEEEELDCEDDVIEACADFAEGSPRQALSNLSMARRAESRKEVIKLLKSAEESDGVIELCRQLYFKNPKFNDVLKTINSFQDDVRPESARLVILNYGTKVVLGSVKKKTNVDKCLAVMEEFETPFNESEGMAPLVLAVGRLLLGD